MLIFQVGRQHIESIARTAVGFLFAMPAGLLSTCVRVERLGRELIVEFDKLQFCLVCRHALPRNQLKKQGNLAQAVGHTEQGKERTKGCSDQQTTVQLKTRIVPSQPPRHPSEHGPQSQDLPSPPTSDVQWYCHLLWPAGGT